MPSSVLWYSASPRSTLSSWGSWPNCMPISPTRVAEFLRLRKFLFYIFIVIVVVVDDPPTRV